MTDTTVRAPAPPGLLYAMADQRRNQLDAREAQATAAMRQQLAGAEARLEAELKAVTDLIDSTPVERRSPAWLFQQARYRELIASVEQELAVYGGQATQQITSAQQWAQVQGGRDAAALGAQAAGVRAGDFMATNLANLSTAVGFLADGSPVADLFAGYGATAVANARQVMSNAVTLGWGSAKTAREFRRTVTGMTRDRSELVARTELHRVYRATSRDTYAANADVLTGWVWLAKLDNRTCPTCIIMSGTMHSLDETLDGHPRCRCAMVPITGPWQAIDPRLAELNTTARVPTGADWLRAQPPATQKAVLGRTKYDLYARGQIDLQDLVKRDRDPVWGTMRREATIAEARAAAAARGIRQTATTARPSRRPTADERRLERINAMRLEREAIEARNAVARVENARLAQEVADLRRATQGHLSPAQYDSLRPDRQWSEAKRQRILDTLRETPEGKVLGDTLERFQDGGSIARLRTKMNQRLAGEAIDATSAARADALLGAIRGAPTDWAPDTLYRGMSVKGSLENVLAKYEPGSQVDLTLTSFTSDRAVAKRFQQMTAGKGTTRVMVEWVGGDKHALPIQDLPKDRRLSREKEWVSAGRWEVAEAKRSPDGSVLVRMRQVGTL